MGNHNHLDSLQQRAKQRVKQRAKAVQRPKGRMGGVNPAAGATQAAKVARLHKAEARGGVPTAPPQGVAGAEPRAHKPFAIPQLTKRHLLVTRRCELANQHLSEKHSANTVVGDHSPNRHNAHCHQLLNQWLLVNPQIMPTMKGCLQH